MLQDRSKGSIQYAAANGWRSKGAYKSEDSRQARITANQSSNATQADRIILSRNQYIARQTALQSRKVLKGKLNFQKSCQTLDKR